MINLADLNLPLSDIIGTLSGILEDRNLNFLRSYAIEAISNLLWSTPCDSQTIEHSNLRGMFCVSCVMI